MERPPKPEPSQCPCGAEGMVRWARRGKGPSYSRYTREGYWSRLTLCSRCRTLKGMHGMTGPEYDEYLAQGCAIEGCENLAVVIDHDHSVCPQGNHSCEKCRRGPLCHYHNRYLITFLDALFSGKLMREIAYVSKRRAS